MCFSKSEPAQVEHVYPGATGSRKHFHTTCLTQANCNSSYEEGVSFYDLPGYSYYHDKPVCQRGFLGARSLLILWGETARRTVWKFALMHSLLWRVPLANKLGGTPSSARDPTEAVIPRRPEHILYFSLWQRWNWAILAWNASAPVEERL